MAAPCAAAIACMACSITGFPAKAAAIAAGFAIAACRAGAIAACIAACCWSIARCCSATSACACAPGAADAGAVTCAGADPGGAVVSLPGTSLGAPVGGPCPPAPPSAPVPVMSARKLTYDGRPSWLTLRSCRGKSQVGRCTTPAGSVRFRSPDARSPHAPDKFSSVNVRERCEE